MNGGKVRHTSTVDGYDMSIDPAPELVRFQQFLGETLERSTDLSPEEALDLWRQQNPATEDFDDTILALDEAIANRDAGHPGQPFDEFDREFRKRHGLS